jgi:serine/threonine protein kinase/Tfp pilus assembly protein PilF
MRFCTAASTGPALDPLGEQPLPGYRLLERVGMGGAGEVWSAEAPGGLRVALKIVRLTGPLGRREMTNLRILRSIRHPNLLAYFGAWQTDGRLIIGMELADRSLWDRFAEARRQGLAGIPLSELLEVLSDTAKVIDFLNEPRHELVGRSGVAIRHRDIKPQNIMLIGQGVKVADFGLSCLDDQNTAPQNLGLTFAYAAPETFRNRVMGQSDQYSLGISYCQLRGGRLPFLGPPATVMLGHLSGEPDLSMLPEPERPIIGRALAKEPDARWPDCKSFARALSHCDAMGSPETIPAATGSARDEISASRSILIPPFSDSSEESISVSDDSAPAIDVSAYCLGEPSVLTNLTAESSSLPTVEVKTATMVPIPERTPRAILIAVVVLAACLTAWYVSWRFPSRPEVTYPHPGPSAGRHPTRQTPVVVAARESPNDAPAIRTSSPPPTPRLPSSRAPEPPSMRTPRAPLPPIDRDRIRKTLARVQPVLAFIQSLLSATHIDDSKGLRERRTGPTGKVAAPAGPGPDATRPGATSPVMIAGAAAPTRLVTPSSANEPRLTMPETVRVEAGRSLAIPIRVTPTAFDVPVTVQFQGLPPGVWLPDLTIPAGQVRAEARAEARADVTSALVTLGVLARAGSRTAEGKIRLEVRANPAMLHRTRGHTLLACGRPAEAVAAFTRALEAGVSDPLVYNNRAFAYTMLNRHDLAIRDYTEASRLKPDDPDIRYNRGMAYLQSGDDDHALLDLDSAIRLDPDHARAYSARARIYLKQGDLARAKADSDRAAQLLQRADLPPNQGPTP